MFRGPAWDPGSPDGWCLFIMHVLTQILPPQRGLAWPSQPPELATPTVPHRTSTSSEMLTLSEMTVFHYLLNTPTVDCRLHKDGTHLSNLLLHLPGTVPDT